MYMRFFKTGWARSGKPGEMSNVTSNAGGAGGILPVFAPLGGNLQPPPLGDTTEPSDTGRSISRYVAL